MAEMANTFEAFLRRNLSFTKRAATLVVALSLLAIARVLLMQTVIDWAIANQQIGAIHIGYFLLPRALPFIYVALFFILRRYNSEYTPVCFARGVVNILPFSTLLSVALIVYVLATSRVASYCSAELDDSALEANSLTAKPTEWSWRTFFKVPTITVGLILALSTFFGTIFGLAGPRPGEAIAMAIMVCCLLGAVVNLTLTVIWVIKGKPVLALGGLLTVFIMPFLAFAGCISAL